MPTELSHPGTPADFAEEVLPFLLEEEALECLLAGIVWAMRKDSRRSDDFYAAGVRQDGRVVAAALRTPLKLLLSRSADPAARPSSRTMCVDVCPTGLISGIGGAIAAFPDETNFLLRTPEALSYRNEQVQQFAAGSRALANGLLAAVALVGGFNVMLRPCWGPATPARWSCFRGCVWARSWSTGCPLLLYVLYVGRISLVVGVGSVVLGGLIGTRRGLVAGYSRQCIENLVMRVVDC